MLPESFKKRMEKLLQDSYGDYIASFDKDCSRALHINKVKAGSVSAAIKLMPFETEKIPFCDDGFYFDADKAGNQATHHAGLFYIQEPSAMCPVSALSELFVPGMNILDVCASPGGKTSQAMNLAAESCGIVFSNEIVPSRCKTLVGNAERLGFKNSVILCADSAFLKDSFPSFFGIVICDAPCSGEGMFRKNTLACDEWSEENVALCALRQKEILNNASWCVADGGYLLYSTCTFSPEENECNVSEFLKIHPDFELVDPCDRVKAQTVGGIAEYCKGFEADHVRRFYPHTAKGEGQFFAILKKKGEFSFPEPFWKDSSRPLTKDEGKAARAFLSDTVGHDNFYLRAYGDNILILPDNLPVPSKHIFSCGVKLGEVKSGRLVPHHHFFSAFGGEFVRKVALTQHSPESAKYLHGEGFEYDMSDGWVSVLIDGIPLGGGKAVGGYIKNHYPKGLRIN